MLETSENPALLGCYWIGDLDVAKGQALRNFRQRFTGNPVFRKLKQLPYVAWCYPQYNQPGIGCASRPVKAFGNRCAQNHLI